MTPLTPPTTDRLHRTTTDTDGPATIAPTDEGGPRLGRDLALRDVSCDLYDGVHNLHAHPPTNRSRQLAQTLTIGIVGVR
jgi:hypothetical protein